MKYRSCGERNKEIIDLHLQGLTTREIKDATGETKDTINRVKARWQAVGDEIFKSTKLVSSHARDKRSRICELDEAGKSKTEIAQETEVSLSSVYRILADAHGESEDLKNDEAAEDHMMEMIKNRTLIKVGDMVVFNRDGREVYAVVIGTNKHTVTCVENRGNYKVTHSPQYQDISAWY